LANCTFFVSFLDACSIVPNGNCLRWSSSKCRSTGTVTAMYFYPEVIMVQTSVTGKSRFVLAAGILAAILLLVLSPCASAQGGNVAITGTVLDATGAVVSGASVTVTQQNTSIVRTGTTS